MDATPYRGHQGIRRYLQDAADVWTSLRFDPERILEGVDDDVVVAGGSLRGEGRRGGVRVEQRIAVIFRLRDAKVRLCHAYPDPEEALRVTGLEK